MCAKEFKSKPSLAGHMRTHSRNETRNVTSVNDSDLKTNDQQPPFVTSCECLVCGRAFSNRGSCITHMKSHGNNEKSKKEWKCKYCPEVLPSCHELYLHKKAHAKSSKQWICAQCGKVFTHRGNYNVHMRNHDTVEEKCGDCGKMLHTWRQKQRHETIHKGKEKSVCNICGKVFLLRQQLKLHMERHDEFKKYQCPMCSKWFQARPDFNQHKARHKKTERKNHVCEQCGMSFSKLKRLKEHEAIHHVREKTPTMLNNTLEYHIPVTTELENNLVTVNYPLHMPPIPPQSMIQMRVSQPMTLQIQSAIDSIQPLRDDFSYQ